MRHKVLIAVLVILSAAFVNLNPATAASVVLNPPEVANLGKAIDPPAGAFVDILPHGATATIVVRGLDVYKNQVYVYGAGKIEAYALVNGEATIPARRWFNLAFKGGDGLWHYLLVDDDYRFVRPEWMGSNVGIKPNTGKGSALTATIWLAPEYR